jgi:membrane protease YdiL (CAAX protease family)
MPGMSKGESIGALMEPLLLYLVLFVPGAVPYSPPPDLIVFSTEREIVRILIYNIPSFALIWYLLLQKKNLRAWGIRPPGKNDLLAAFCAIPGLLLIGLVISAVSPLFTELPAGAGLTAPGSLSGWIVMILSCISTGYLEESFFRFYLLTRLHEFGIRSGKLVCLSVLLFALCHVYEGPWGMLNAVLAGTLLSFLFLHFRSLHGIALAHGLYNAFVYALGV